MSERSLIEKAGSSTEINLHPEVEGAGVRPHHEDQQLSGVLSELGELGVQATQEATPISTAPSSVVQFPTRPIEPIQKMPPVHDAGFGKIVFKRRQEEKMQVGSQKNGVPKRSASELGVEKRAA